jgi:AhpD family alkylhydroperoxidase
VASIANAKLPEAAPARPGLIARLAFLYSRRRYGKVLGPVALSAHHPRLLLGYGAFETAIERSHLVDEALKNLAVMKAAALVGCEWCIDFGSALSLRHGVTEAQLRELPRFRESEAFSRLEKLVLEYAEAITRTPSEVDAALLARLREHFDEPQLVELTATIGIENYRARCNHAFGLPSEGFSAGGACAVPEQPEAGKTA